MSDNGNAGELATSTDKKPRHRSPNYPGIGLREAVDKIGAIYKEDKLAPSPKVAALKHMGYENPHGEAGRILSALKSFGLIEEVNDRIKFTQHGIDIVVRAEDDSIRLAALQRATVNPGIYRDLLKEYRESGLPSDTALRSELIAVKKFNPNAVDAFIRTFRDSLEFAGLSDLSLLEFDLTEEEQMPETAERAGHAPLPPVAQARIAKSPAMPLKPPASGASLLAQTLPISIPRNLVVEVQVRGDELKKEDLAKIKSQITRWLEGLEEAFD